VKITMSMARRLALWRQALDGQWRAPPGREGVAQTIERLGYVQIDTIAVVQRAHHHTLWVRRPDYAPYMLDELQAQDRRVFEWWAPAMSYLPMRDYRYYLPRMQAHASREHTRAWIRDHKELVDLVRERIRTEGPLGSADFRAPEGFKRSTWWSWKPAKRALETLCNCGELMVTERRSFQRIYDLRERVLPDDVDVSEPDAAELGRFLARRAVGSLGFAARDDVRWGRRTKWRSSGEALAELADAGEITEVEIDGVDGRSFYALTTALRMALADRAAIPAVHILSPFDSLVIQRGWLRTFFDFDYKLEAYTPAAQRRYGYFSLPVLWGDRFVARMDAKAERTGGTLILRGLTFEPGFEDYDQLLSGFAHSLNRFASFNGCQEIDVRKTEPEQVAEKLQAELSR
jgi:uncharacterized protein YcaQ